MSLKTNESEEDSKFTKKMSVPVSDILKKGDIKGDDLTMVVLSPDEHTLSQGHQQNVDRLGTRTRHTSDRTG